MDKTQTESLIEVAEMRAKAKRLRSYALSLRADIAGRLNDMADELEERSAALAKESGLREASGRWGI